MDNLEFKQITELDEQNLDIMTNWMYNWWGKEEGYTFESIKCYLKHSFQKDRLPKTYGVFYDEILVGMFQFTYSDLEIRPDIYPWLANLYVDEKYRNKGLARVMLEKVNEIARTSLNFNELYLFTKHIDLYEKFGWTYISELDTYTKNPRIQKLYKLKLK